MCVHQNLQLFIILNVHTYDVRNIYTYSRFFSFFSKARFRITVNLSAKEKIEKDKCGLKKSETVVKKYSKIRKNE